MSGLKGMFLGSQSSSFPVQVRGKLGKSVPRFAGCTNDTCVCRKCGNGTDRLKALAGCRQGNCFHCQQLNMFRKHELGLGDVWECPAANGLPLLWERRLRFGWSLDPGEGFRSIHHCEGSGSICWVSVSNTALMALVLI